MEQVASIVFHYRTLFIIRYNFVFQQVTTDNSNTNLNTPTSVASNVKMAGNHRRGIFYLRQQTTASGIRANGDCRVEIKGASNDNSTASSEEMGEF